MRANAATFVYTPQVLVQGHDAAWQRGAVGTLVDAARQREARASVTLDAVADGERGYAVQTRAMVPDRTLRSHAVLWLAYADSGLVSDVKAGENRGVRLVHDYVVRSLAGPFPVGSNGEAHAQVNLARPAEGGKRPALVAIVQDGKTGEVLQTLAMPACAGP